MRPACWPARVGDIGAIMQETAVAQRSALGNGEPKLEGLVRKGEHGHPRQHDDLLSGLSSVGLMLLAGRSRSSRQPSHIRALCDRHQAMLDCGPAAATFRPLMRPIFGSRSFGCLKHEEQDRDAHQTLLSISDLTLSFGASAQASGKPLHDRRLASSARTYEPPNPCRRVNIRRGNACGVAGKFHRSGRDPSAG
jgi:hypothetical protein